MPGTLYIIATPIGNLEDITLRAISILKEVDIVLAEDTRHTQKLLDYIFSNQSQIPARNASHSDAGRTNHQSMTKPKLLSYYQHSGEGRRLEILNHLMDGKNLALVTDAGTPGISDPGNELIDFLLSYKSDIKIVPVPGASAIIAALSVCGFNVNHFVFLGFWPKKKVNKLIELIKLTKSTFVFYDSPFRIMKTLETLEKAFGKDTRIFVGRELTKLHETLYRGKISDVRSLLEKERVRGEITVVVEL